MKSKNIAIAGEITPSKTIIPIIEKLREREKEGKLSFKINKLIGLYHGESSKDFLEPYCDETYSIGEGRRGKKNSAGKLAYLISKDILKSFNALKGKGIDLLITAGNAGDVRKAIVAANILKIPVLHIEQDIYNPIEVISQANLVTVPSNAYKEYLETQIIPALPKDEVYRQKIREAMDLKTVFEMFHVREPYSVDIEVDMDDGHFYKRFDFYSVDPESEYCIVLKTFATRVPIATPTVPKVNTQATDITILRIASMNAPFLVCLKWPATVTIF